MRRQALIVIAFIWIAASLAQAQTLSGYRQPSRANAEAFNAAVAEIAESSRRLLAVVAVPRGAA